MNPVKVTFATGHCFDQRQRRALRFAAALAVGFTFACSVDGSGVAVSTEAVTKAANNPLGAAKDTILVSKVENKGGGSENDSAVTYRPSVASCDDAVALTDMPVDKFAEASGMSTFQLAPAATTGTPALTSLVVPTYIIISVGPVLYKTFWDWWQFGYWTVIKKGVPDIEHAVPIWLPPWPKMGDMKGRVDAESAVVLECGEKLSPKNPARMCLVVANTDSSNPDEKAIVVYGLGSDPSNPFKREDIELLNYFQTETQQVVALGNGESYQVPDTLAFSAMTAYPVDDAFAGRNGCGTVSTLTAIKCNFTEHPEMGDTLIFVSRASADVATLQPTLVFAAAPEVWRNNDNFKAGVNTKVVLRYLGEIPMVYLTAADARASGQVQEFLDAMPAGEHKALAERILTVDNLSNITVDDLKSVSGLDFGTETVKDKYIASFDKGWENAHESPLFDAMVNTAEIYPIGQPLVLSTYHKLWFLDVDIFALPKTSTFLTLQLDQSIVASLPQTEGVTSVFSVDAEGQLVSDTFFVSEVEQDNFGNVVADPSPQPMLSQRCIFSPRGPGAALRGD